MFKFKSISIASILLSTVAVLCVFLNSSCGGGGVEVGTDTTSNDTPIQPLPLNISIFLDLSDRLDRPMTPSQTERDIEIVDHIVNLFINDCQTNGHIIASKSHIQVFFYPAPNSSTITTLAKELNVDMSKLKAPQKKVELNNMKQRFNKNLTQIYNDAVTEKKWVGCDIWGFFSNKNVDVQCLREGYRNILVILTDGYLYHVNNKQKEGTAYSYVLPQTLAVGGSSLIVKRKGLENLEVLMLEINPYQLNQREPLVNVLENWFEGMEVNRFAVSETDLSANTFNVIDNFFK